MRLPTEDESEGNHKAAREKRPLDPETPLNDDQKQPNKRRGSKKHDAEDMNSEPLDYGDESSHPPPSAEKPPMSRAPYQGRRIISYDD